MKLFTAGIETETNTFSPMPTGLSHFDVLRATDIAHDADRLASVVPFNIWQQQCLSLNANFIFGLYAVAEPSGPTTREAYETLRDELLDELEQQLPVDGVLLCLHGAMVADGYEDCEGDLIEQIRQRVGENTVISAELDLHCHLTAKMLQQADVIITLKEYPHIDVEARARELFHITCRTIEGNYLPTMACSDCRMVGLYPTTTAVMRGFIDEMQTIEQQEGVLSVSFIHGFPFGDVQEAGGKILVVTDNNHELASQVAKTLAQKLYALRKTVGFDALTLTQALTKASASDQSHQAPVVVADQSDNPGGGAPGDATYALQWLLDNDITGAALAIFYDPEVVKVAKAAGTGATIHIRLGGKMGPASGDPLDLVVTVVNCKQNYIHRFPQSQGEPVLLPAGDTVALQCRGNAFIVSSQRTQCFSPCIFDDFGIAATDQKILIVKSSQHFYGAFAPIAKEIIYMSGPGALSAQVKTINYQHMRTDDKYPWVDQQCLEDQ